MRKSANLNSFCLCCNGGHFCSSNMMGPQISAEVVDEDTVAVITADVDPLLPRRMYLGGVTSAQQILDNPEDHNVNPIGTGPYAFDEWELAHGDAIDEIFAAAMDRVANAELILPAFWRSEEEDGVGVELIVVSIGGLLAV